MTKTNTATAAKRAREQLRPVLKHFNLSLVVVSVAVFASKVGCECVRHTLRKNLSARPTEACVVSLNKVRSDSTNEIFKCSTRSSCLDSMAFLSESSNQFCLFDDRRRIRLRDYISLGLIVAIVRNFYCTRNEEN